MPRGGSFDQHESFLLSGRSDVRSRFRASGVGGIGLVSDIVLVGAIARLNSSPIAPRRAARVPWTVDYGPTGATVTRTVSEPLRQAPNSGETVADCVTNPASPAPLVGGGVQHIDLGSSSEPHVTVRLAGGAATHAVTVALSTSKQPNAVNDIGIITSLPVGAQSTLYPRIEPTCWIPGIATSTKSSPGLVAEKRCCTATGTTTVAVAVAPDSQLANAVATATNTIVRIIVCRFARLHSTSRRQ